MFRRSRWAQTLVSLKRSPARSRLRRLFFEPLEDRRVLAVDLISAAFPRTGNGGSSNATISADGRYVAFESDAANLVAGDTNAATDVFVYDRQAGFTARVSVATGGAQADGRSYRPSISADGRYVAFNSLATNLVAGDSNGVQDLYVHDRQTGVTTRVSVDSSGGQANGLSHGSIGPDGRYVTFTSEATNLVAGDSNGNRDVFVHDRQTGATTRVSTDSSGNQLFAAAISGGSISADGRYVEFVSSSRDLVTGDTNGTWDVFVKDRQTEAVTRVSVDSSGGQANGGSLLATISANGRYVAFQSFATNLVPGDTFAQDIFVHDRQTGATTRVSVDSSGGQANGSSFDFSISADGRFVVFSSGASNLVANDTNGTDDIFLHDRQTGTTSLITALGGFGLPVNGRSFAPSVSADGRYVAFHSIATNLVFDSNGNTIDFNGNADVFIHDRTGGSMNVLSNQASVTTLSANDNSQQPWISGDGRYVAFTSRAFNLVQDDGNASTDIFVRDRQSDVTTRVSVSTSGEEGNFDSEWPSMSADGRYVAFSSEADNLVAGDTNGFSDIFVHDRQTRVTSLVSVSSKTFGASSQPFISGDGRYVAFTSWGDNLVSGDTNSGQDVFVHDRQTGATTRVSVHSSGAETNQFANSYLPSLSADGRYVAFMSNASNLVANDTNGRDDIFLHDRQTGATTRLSVSSGGSQGNGNSGVPIISADGRYVAFASDATNFVVGDTNGRSDIFIHEVATGITTRVSVDSSGTQSDGNSFDAFPSGDGRYVAFHSFATNLVTGDTNAVSDIFLHDRQTGITTRVSVSGSGVQSNGGSSWTTISADGQHIAFQSTASNLSPLNQGTYSDVFVAGPSNTPPAISDIVNRATDEDLSTGAIDFTIGDIETAAGSLTVTATSSNQTVIPDANITLAGGGANRTIAILPAGDQSGTATITVTVSDGALTASDTFVLTVNPVNDAPTISPLADQTVSEDFSTGALSFVVGDPETAPGSLQVTATSSNQAVVPDARITLGGSGANRTISILPAENQSGAATITVTVSDGTLSATKSFLLTVNPVNDTPTISDIADRATNEDVSTGAIGFVVGDIETASGSLTVTASSSNQTVVPDANISLGGSGANRTIAILPAENQSGTATITVTVSDGVLSATDTFVLTVNPVNDAPTISDIADRDTNEDVSTGAIGVSIGDIDTPLGSLTLTAASSDQALIPEANITLGGSGANRTIAILPAENKAGTATITVTVSDGTLSATDTFVLTVNPLNDSPTISDIADQVTIVATATSAIGFTIGDVETAAASLGVTAASSNQALVPDANITLGGSGANRTIVIIPAGTLTGTATITVTVSDGAASTSDTFVVAVNPNPPPTIVNAASASPNPVAGATTSLSVLGNDNGGEANLTYTWAATSRPGGAADPTYSANGTNVAKASTATFFAAGDYTMQVTVRDTAGLTATSSVVVTVNQTLTSIVVTPVGANVPLNGTLQYSAQARDQFGNPLVVQPTFTWSKPSGPGSLDPGGLFTAGIAVGAFQVQATSGLISGTAIGAVVNTAPIVTTPATATPNPAAGVTTPLSVLGADDNGEANLNYTWSVQSMPSGATAPTFSANGTNAAKNTTITVNKAGSYALRATISDGTLSVTSDVTLVIDYTLGQNSAKPADVTGDGRVDASDILAVVNFIIAFGTGASSPTPVPPDNPPLRRDVNADGIINALDILGVVNYIIANPIGGSGGEGESTIGPVQPSRWASSEAAEVPESLLAVLAADVAHGRRRKSFSP